MERSRGISYVLLSLLCFLPGLVLSQELPLRHYTSDKEINPLPGTSITAVLQDAEGFIWLAAYGQALVRYDGSKMEQFPAADSLNVLIFSLTQDRKGRLWVGHNDGVSATVRPLPGYAPGEKPVFTNRLDDLPLLNHRISKRAQILADSKGRIWCAGSKILLCYYYGDDDRLAVDTIPLDRPSGEEAFTILGLLERKDGSIWAVTSSDHILEFPDGGTEYRAIRLLVDPTSTGNAKNTLYLAEDAAGTVWGARNDGLVWRIVSRDSVLRAEAFSRTPGVGLSSLLRTKGGRILAGSLGGGLLGWDKDHPEDLQTYTLHNGLLSTIIWDLMEDREGSIWVATNGGLSRMPGDYRAFGLYNANSVEGAPNMLPDDGVLTVLADMNWPPTGEKLLVVGTAQGISFIRSDGSREIVQVAHGLLNNAVLTLNQDAAGRLWVGGRGGFTCISLDPRPLGPAGFSAPVKHSLWGVPVYLSKMPAFQTNIIISQNTEDGRKEPFIWFMGTNELLCLEGNQWYFFPKAKVVTSPNMRVLGIDDQGYVYLGSLSDGLLRSNYPLTPDKIRSLKSAPWTEPGFEMFLEVQEPVFSPFILMDGADTVTNVTSLKLIDEVMWVGTDQGIFGIRGDSVAFRVTAENGLQAKAAMSMAMSGEPPLLWLGDAKYGLEAIDPVSRRSLRNIRKTNGLPDDRTWGYTALDADADGVLYWGTSKGLSIYNPLLDEPDTVAPLLKFRQFSLTQNGWGNNELAAEYACLSFYDEKGTRFQTRLVGYDKDWSAPTADNRLRYTNLPAFLFPKTYVFEVRAQNVFGAEASAPLSYRFSVLPPIWLRWWAVLGYLVILSGVLWLFVRWRTRQQEEALARERQVSEQLRQVDALKDQFLANTSHELRTPLNGIIGLSESWFDRVAEPALKSDLDLIISSGKRLANLVNDILDFSKLKNDQLTLQLGAVDLYAITDVVFNLNRPLISDKPIQLLNEVPRALPLAEADENRVQQIMHNLIGNAVKFTPKGSVTVTGEVKDGMVEITVSDTGIGIPAAKIDDIFRAFEQGDGSTAREYGGTGLGLTVTRRLVEAHGGNILVRSTPGEGSHFTFSLPIRQVAAADGKARPVQPAATRFEETVNPLDRGEAGVPAVAPKETKTMGAAALEGAISILIVDDEPVNLRVLNNHLSQEGYQVHTASDGERALEMLRSGKKFDLIVLDIMMPRMSGFEVCEELRHIFLPSELPVVMLTAKNRVTDLVDGFNAGANDYLTKPFSKDELLSRIKTHLRLHRINRAAGKFVPNEFLRSIGRETITEVQLGDLAEREVTVFFSDIRDFTNLTESMTPEQAFKFVNAYNGRMGPIIKRQGGFVNQYLGDAIMALFPDVQTEALGAAVQMQQSIQSYNRQREQEGRRPIRVGMGLHTGPLIMGVIGDQDRLDAAIIADTVNTASRIENLTKHFGVNILLSESTLAGISGLSAFHVRPIGKFLLKGKQELVDIFECFDGDDPEIFRRKLDTLPVFEMGIARFFARRFAEASEAFRQVLAVHPDDQPARLFLAKSEALERDGVPDDWTGVEKMLVK